MGYLSSDDGELCESTSCLRAAEARRRDLGPRDTNLAASCSSTDASLSDGGGRASGRPESLEDLANLSDADIDKHWDRIIGTAGPTFGGLLR